MIDESRPFIAVRIAVMTVSDTRTTDDDRSGDTLATRIEDAGHTLADRVIVRDESDAITSQLYTWIDDKTIDIIISTGGTGITGRDITPECFEALYTKHIPGFGELFRMLSYETIGTSTIQSRATAGIAGTTLMFALPGSTGAVKDGWDKILKTQLDNRYRPCNFIELMPRFGER
ncbi:molybdenum cofactor biosynthesis protein B [Kordiimonas aestuarii]|uniref:molybdenum cofactor biosynthesis protein B n=1 Tax=Kordiimonas aestuarii TaxID=1005925 RepID=UPI0021CF3812|nr:molybdenum cofactor biosynthesis protein B [Kordiimonas aestuarii]